MEKKEKKLPNRVEGEGRIELPPEANVKIEKKWVAKDIKDPLFTSGITSFHFTSSSPLDPDFLKYLNFLPETSVAKDYIPSQPTFTAPWYNKDEKLKSEIANLRYKSKQLLNHTFSIGVAYNEFGNTKFPKNANIKCYKCDSDIDYIVDFFTHVVISHGDSPQEAVNIFDRILDKIQKI